MDIFKKQYKVIIEQDQDGFFIASVPELPGCHTQARTIDELHNRIREAISLCLEVANEDEQYMDRIKQLSYEPQFVGLDMVQA